jgi:hypothetical protein
MGWLLNDIGNDCLLYLLNDSFLGVRGSTTFVNQIVDSAIIDQFTIAIERISRHAHDFAGPRDVTELFR